MDRTKTFMAYKTAPWFHKVFAKLGKADLEMALQFIADNDHLDKGQFEFKINRMFLDKPKPRNYKVILELLCCANSASGKTTST